MMRRIVIIYCLLLALILLLSSCGSSEEEKEIPTNTRAPVADEVVQDPADAPLSEPTDVPTATAEAQEIESPPVEEQEPLTLVAVENEAMGLKGLVPEGWQEAAPGVYARGQSIEDVTRLIQQAAPGMGVDDLSALLLQQLGVDSLPERHGSIESGSFSWDLFVVDVSAPTVGTVRVDLALAETDTGAYIVLLQTSPEEYDALHESTFLPAVDALELLSEDGPQQIYENPDRNFAVPIPTNWTAGESEGYVTLASPEEDIKVYIVVVDGEDPRDAVTDAWKLVDPEFDRLVNEVTEVPASAAGGVDEYVVVDYDWDQGQQPIIQAEARLYDGMVYVLMYVMTLEAAQQRSSQIQIISSGFNISDLETVDLSGVEPLLLTDELVVEFEAFIAEKMDQLDVPGASIAVVQDGQLVYANGFGVRSHETGEAVTPETLMMVGSTTKSLTTMLMAQLVDEGVFDWDTRAVEILPTFAVADPDITDQITMRNLVCACTGVPRRDLEWLFNSDDLSAEMIIESLEEFEFFTDFGEAFQYSNQMVAAGGYLATHATGAEYGDLQDAYTDLLEERVLGPIGMDSSTFSFDEIAGNGQYARPHGKTLIGETVEIPLSYEASLAPLAPAGAMWSNVLDMSNYILTELNGGVSPSGERVVSTENLAVTWEPQVDISAEASYGLGWIIEDKDGLTVISHAGNTFGFSSEFAFAPAANLGISVLTNQQGSLFNPLVRAWLFEKLFQQEPETEELLQFLLEQTEETQSSIRRSLVDGIDPTSVEDYLGIYKNEDLGEATLEWEDDKLILDVGEYRIEIRALRDNDDIRYGTFSPPVAGLPLKFEADDSGAPVMILGLGVVEYSFQKTG
ncbi:MAG: serine hydrolase domain-containing protein [Candidatus Promineifilaceae bacterium]